MAHRNVGLAVTLVVVAVTTALLMGVAAAAPPPPPRAPPPPRIDPVVNYDVLTLVNGREAFFCRGNLRCAVQICPRACRSRSIEGPGNAACFINCAACTIGCKHRKPNCVGFGAVCYDPRFIGGDGVMFYFHGEKEKDFCILSDKNLHINAHFIGKRPEGRSRDYTWVQGLGMLFGSHKLGISAKKTATWSEKEDHFSISFDDEEIVLPEFHSALWTSPSGNVVIERVTDMNNVHLVIDQLMEVILEVVPITKEDSRVHNYQIDDTDCFAHLQMQFNFLHLSPAVDGVLGQTYRPDYKSPVKVGVPMPLMGGEEKFRSSSMFSTDCKSTKFAPSESTFATEKVIELLPAHCNNADGSLTCRR